MSLQRAIPCALLLAGMLLLLVIYWLMPKQIEPFHPESHKLTKDAYRR